MEVFICKSLTSGALVLSSMSGSGNRDLFVVVGFEVSGVRCASVGVVSVGVVGVCVGECPASAICPFGC